MSDAKRPADLAEELFHQKRMRRRALAALTVEEKFQILLRLQRLSCEVALAAGRKPRAPWRIGEINRDAAGPSDSARDDQVQPG